MPNRQEIGTIDDPSFVWFEDSGETYLELQDSDGNVIIRFNQDESISNVGSLSLEQASINDHTEDDPKELVTHVDESVSSGTINQTVSIDVNEYQPYLIEVLNFQAGNGEDLQLEIEGFSDGEYDYTKRDEAGSFTSVTNVNQIELITTTQTSGDDRHAGLWHMYFRNRPIIFGKGAPSFRAEGEYLDNTQLNQASNPDPFDLTIKTTTGDAALNMAIWQLQDRSAI